MPKNRYKGDRIGLVYPWLRFDEFLDVLRNKRLLYAAFIGSDKLGYIFTNQDLWAKGMMSLNG